MHNTCSTVQNNHSTHEIIKIALSLFINIQVGRSFLYHRESNDRVDIVAVCGRDGYTDAALVLREACDSAGEHLRSGKFDREGRQTEHVARPGHDMEPYRIPLFGGHAPGSRTERTAAGIVDGRTVFSEPTPISFRRSTWRGSMRPSGMGPTFRSRLPSPPAVLTSVRDAFLQI